LAKRLRQSKEGFGLSRVLESLTRGSALDLGPITIPKDPDGLREELIKQISAMEAGHGSTFNHANAIMSELLKQKLMTSKEYRDILKHIFHV
jgi:hypothetical protein